jgi:hypothetical protein
MPIGMTTDSRIAASIWPVRTRCLPPRFSTYGDGRVFFGRVRHHLGQRERQDLPAKVLLDVSSDLYPLQRMRPVTDPRNSCTDAVPTAQGGDYRVEVNVAP